LTAPLKLGTMATARTFGCNSLIGQKMQERRELPLDELYRRRLTLPAYELKDAARYARVTAQNVRDWQRQAVDGTSALAARQPRAALSYLQLQELAIVATMRELGVELREIRLARDYLSERLSFEFPFADQRLKTDGQRILMDGADGLGPEVQVLIVNQGGQIAWDHMLSRRFEEFDYVQDLALRWHVAGRGKRVLIDPRIAFGAPMVKGVATWVLRGRWVAGESIDEIASDFSLDEDEVREGLIFEGIDPSTEREQAVVAS
jgi:uncharacterized protein (DUF433 family)